MENQSLELQVWVWVWVWVWVMYYISSLNCYAYYKSGILDLSLFLSLSLSLSLSFSLLSRSRSLAYQTESFWHNYWTIMVDLAWRYCMCPLSRHFGHAHQLNLAPPMKSSPPFHWIRYNQMCSYFIYGAVDRPEPKNTSIKTTKYIK